MGGGHGPPSPTTALPWVPSPSLVLTMDRPKKEPARRNGDIDIELQADGTPGAATLRREVVEILSGAIARLVITGEYRRVNDRARHVAHDIAHGDAR